MSWVAVAIGGSALIGGLSSYLGGKSQSNSASKANQANIAAQDRTNALNKQMFDESRGSTGHALLPTYFGNTEMELGGYAADASRAIFKGQGSPDEQYAKSTQYLNDYRPAMNEGTQFVDDLFSGAGVTKRIDNLDPVNAARLNRAKTAQSAISDGLRDAIARMEAGNTTKGYLGGSTFDNNRMATSQVGARQQAALAQAQAEFENAQAVQGLQESDYLTRLNNLALPYQMGSQRMAFERLPAESIGRNIGAAMAPMNFFRMQPQAFRYDPSVAVQPTTTDGQLLGAAGASAARTATDYFSNKAIMNMLSNQQGLPEISLDG